MTLDELADLTADKLEALSDEELTATLSPFFAITRPELAPRPTQRQTLGVDPAMLQGIAKLKELGIDASYLLKRKKK